MNNENKSHLSNLISLAYADGRLDDNEKKMLMETGLKMGFTEKEILDQLENPEEIPFFYPEELTKRYSQLYDFLKMIAIDGSIHENEISLLKRYASQLGFDPEMVNPLIEKTRDFVENGFIENTIDANLKNLFNP